MVWILSLEVLTDLFKVFQPISARLEYESVFNFTYFSILQVQNTPRWGQPCYLTYKAKEVLVWATCPWFQSYLETEISNSMLSPLREAA